jgi:hypothetical protein
MYVNTIIRDTFTMRNLENKYSKAYLAMQFSQAVMSAEICDFTFKLEKKRRQREEEKGCSE